jgi:hypothetical protein
MPDLKARKALRRDAAAQPGEAVSLRAESRRQRKLGDTLQQANRACCQRLGRLERRHAAHDHDRPARTSALRRHAVTAPRRVARGWLADVATGSHDANERRW